MPDPLCLCRKVETIIPTFLECSYVANLWGQVEIRIRKHIDKHAQLSNVEKIFGVDADNLAVNAMIMATKEVIYRKRQGNGIPNILHMKRILYNQMIKEKVLLSSKVFEKKGFDLMHIYLC